MSDSHLRVLRAVARQSRRQLEAFDTAPGAADTGSRLDLSERAARTKSRLAAAAARRRLISGRGTPAKTDPGVHK